MDSVEIHRCAQGSIILPSGVGHRGTKLDEEGEAVAPPALPPRPPPRPRNIGENTSASVVDVSLRRRRVRKYVFLCTVCGGLASLLGAFFLTVYLTLRTYTSSLDYFETIPTYIPAAMLMMTGLSVMCLAKRKNRYVFLIKLCGICCLLCAGTCVLVTVTTTVLHMSRLQSLRECVYTLKTQTCTCYSVLLESASERIDDGTRYVFSSTPDCEVIHGALYSCLRALFGISVTGILVCIFCCMLVYQLLSHERKKMYWEQLELRCRYLYGQAPPTQMHNTPNVLPNTQTTQHCACCQQFRYQQDVMAWEPTDNRFWTGGHVGNLYSPNPVGEECNISASTPSRTSSGWSWRRLPWARQSGDSSVAHPMVSQQRDSGGYHCPMNCSSPDSQYGFSVGQSGGIATVSTRTASYTMIDPVSQLNPPGCQVYQWGPPPPYSDPNSPSRRGLCPPGPHHHHCQGGRSGKESRQGENYVNATVEGGEAAGDEGSSSVFSNEESCLALTLRIPSRKPDIPPSSSSSSVKSNLNPNLGGGECSHQQRPCHRQEIKSLPRHDDNINIGSCRGCRVSPRLKYLQGKPQNTTENPIRKQVQELTESEVYFADVSSCCNVSVKNDSMSIYDEALGMKPVHNGERVTSLPSVSHHQHHHHINHIKKHPRFVHSSETKLTSLQVNDTEGGQKRSECHQIPEEVMNFHRVSSPDECFCSEMIMDGSEEDDPELVSFSRQRQTSLRNRMVAFHSVEGNKPVCDTNRTRQEPGLGDHDDFPSAMSISSPSTTSKGNGGFYAEAVNSDNGSSDSVWMGYSPDFLAPDAQYETIAEHRLILSDDFNGNPKENNENVGNPKTVMPVKRKIHLPTLVEGWSVTNSSFNGSIEDVPEERQRYHVQNINSSKEADKTRGINLNSPRGNEKRLGNMMHSPKGMGRSVKISNVQSVPEIMERRRGELLNTGRICEIVDSNQCCVKNEDSKICELLNPSRSYEPMCEPNTEKQNMPNIFERCREVLTSPPKPTPRGSTVNTNLINSKESVRENQCCHSESNCRCYDVEGDDQSEIRSVDV